MNKAYLLCGMAMAAMTATTGPAWAQADTAAPELAPGDIIVTAQRRSELARDVPISLTALSGEQLAAAGVTDTRDLQTLTPALKIDRTGVFTIPSLRGISATATGPANDTNVALYLDGVYQPATTAGTFDLPDVERVEVLKGPQGTLFGRNATGGAIQVFTKKPSYDLEGSATLSYANFDEFIAKGFISAPIAADKAAISLAGYYRRADTYYNNIRAGTTLEGDKSVLVRGKLRLNPTDNLEIVLTGAYGDRRETIALYGNPLNGNTVTRVLDPNAIIPVRPFDVALNDEARPQRIKSYDLSGRVEFTLPHGTLSSITAWLKREVDGVIDADYAYAPNGSSINYHTTSLDRYFSQEVNYASDLDGAFNFVVGAFYTDGLGAWDGLDVQFPGGGVTIFGFQEVESIAGFGELYFDVTDRLHLIGGLRYSWEKRTFDGTTIGTGPFAPKPAALPRVGSRSWDSFTPRASVRYDLTPTSNVYFTFSQGFKSGVFNTNNTYPRPDGSLDVANPEKITSYELGFKGRIADGLTLDLAGFYYDYKDLQVTITRQIGNPPVSLSTIENAASARVYGLEADATYRFSPMFDIRAAAAYIDAKYKDYTNTLVYAPNPTMSGNVNVPYNANGQRMPRAPKFTGTFTANAHLPVAGGMLDVSGTAYYSSRFNLTLDGRIAQRDYVTLDARAGWTPENSGFTLSVFGKNLTDRTILSGAFLTDSADGVSWAPPRTYGVQVDYRF